MANEWIIGGSFNGQWGRRADSARSAYFDGNSLKSGYTSRFLGNGENTSSQGALATYTNDYDDLWDSYDPNRDRANYGIFRVPTPPPAPAHPPPPPAYVPPPAPSAPVYNYQPPSGGGNPGPAPLPMPTPGGGGDMIATQPGFLSDPGSIIDEYLKQNPYPDIQKALEEYSASQPSAADVLKQYQEALPDYAKMIQDYQDSQPSAADILKQYQAGQPDYAQMLNNFQTTAADQLAAYQESSNARNDAFSQSITDQLATSDKRFSDLQSAYGNQFQQYQEANDARNTSFNQAIQDQLASSNSASADRFATLQAANQAQSAAADRRFDQYATTQNQFMNTLAESQRKASLKTPAKNISGTSYSSDVRLKQNNKKSAKNNMGTSRFNRGNFSTGTSGNNFKIKGLNI